MKSTAGVFFDCWDTVIRFKMKTEDWNVQPLYDHAINREDIDWKEVRDFSDKFFDDYYFHVFDYEITVNEYLNLLILNFDIKLNAPLSQVGDEILDYLDPTPVDGLMDFLKYLDDHHITYAILSNTIYSKEASFKLINRLLPGHHFQFFLASSDIGVKKPSALFFKTGVHMAKMDIKESVYIGDNFFADVSGSYHAGFKKSVWLNHKNHDKNRYRDRLSDFDEIKYDEVHGYDELSKIIEEL